MKILLPLFLLLAVFPVSVSASSLVKIDRSGELSINVLSYTSEQLSESSREIVVTKLANTHAESGSDVILEKNGGEIALLVGKNGSERTADVTDYTDSIIEIEEKVAPQKITISVAEDRFILDQRGISAVTDYPIYIKSEDKAISVKTPTGLRYLSTLPYEAVASLVKTNIINSLDRDIAIFLTEDSDGELNYSISGERKVRLFNVISFSVPVQAQVSATTGNLIKVDQPTWFKIVGFVFS